MKKEKMLLSFSYYLQNYILTKFLFKVISFFNVAEYREQSRTKEVGTQFRFLKCLLSVMLKSVDNTMLEKLSKFTRTEARLLTWPRGKWAGKEDQLRQDRAGSVGPVASTYRSHKISAARNLFLFLNRQQSFQCVSYFCSEMWILDRARLAKSERKYYTRTSILT